MGKRTFARVWLLTVALLAVMVIPAVAHRHHRPSQVKAPLAHAHPHAHPTAAKADGHPAPAMRIGRVAHRLIPGRSGLLHRPDLPARTLGHLRE